MITFWRFSSYVIFIPIVLMIIGMLGMSGCKKNTVKIQTDRTTVRTVYARVAESGIIQPTIDVPVAPDVSGEVVFIAVQEGAKVKKGDLLVTIRPDDYKALLEQTEASLSRSRAAYLQAKANMSQSKATLLQDSVALKRSEQLYEEKVVSKVDLENAQLRFNVSKSQYEAAIYSVQSAFYQVKNSEATRKQARQNLDRTNIYASMDGTITQLNIEIGQRVVGTSQMAGTEILKIADLSSMEVVVEINENDIINVNLNDSAKIEVDAFPDKTFFGNVTEIAYSAQVAALGSSDQVTNFEVKVRITPASYSDLVQAAQEESPFRPGMTSLVEIYTRKEQNAVTVPIQAVTVRKKKKSEDENVTQVADSDDSEEVVFRVKDGKVERIVVETGISDDTHIHILSGLQDNDKVVTGPYTTLSRSLRDGMEVEVEDESSSRGRFGRDR